MKTKGHELGSRYLPRDARPAALCSPKCPCSV